MPLNGPADAVLARRAGDGEADGLVFGTMSWDALRKGWGAAVEAELQDLLGHSSHAMVRRYSHLAPENLRAAVSRLDGVMLPGGPGGSRAEEAETLIASQ